MISQLQAKTTSGGKKALECEDSGELRVVICGVQADGTITPVKVDSTGRIVLSA